MTLITRYPMKGEHMSEAYGGCSCMCHRVPNIFHCVPCCYPGKENILEPLRTSNLVYINYIELGEDDGKKE